MSSICVCICKYELTYCHRPSWTPFCSPGCVDCRRVTNVVNCVVLCPPLYCLMKRRGWYYGSTVESGYTAAPRTALFYYILYIIVIFQYYYYYFNIIYNRVHVYNCIGMYSYYRLPNDSAGTVFLLYNRCHFYDYCSTYSHYHLSVRV